MVNDLRATMRVHHGEHSICNLCALTITVAYESLLINRRNTIGETRLALKSVRSHVDPFVVGSASLAERPGSVKSRGGTTTC